MLHVTLREARKEGGLLEVVYYAKSPVLRGYSIYVAQIQILSVNTKQALDKQMSSDLTSLV